MKRISRSIIRWLEISCGLHSKTHQGSGAKRQLHTVCFIHVKKPRGYDNFLAVSSLVSCHNFVFVAAEQVQCRMLAFYKTVVIMLERGFFTPKRSELRLYYDHRRR